MNNIKEMKNINKNYGHMQIAAAPSSEANLTEYSKLHSSQGYRISVTG